MVKKYFVSADVHDDTEAMTRFTSYAAAQSPDGILFLGDFSLRPYEGADLEELVRTQQARPFIEAKRSKNSRLLQDMKHILDSSGVPYFVIPGNYDPSIQNIFGDNDLHLRTTMLREAKVGGYGGSDAFPPHIAVLNQLGEIAPFDHQQLYDFLLQQRPDILVSHNPPRQFCDDMFNGQNVGTPATTKYIAEHSPKVVLAGHVHEAGPLGNNPRHVRGIARYEHPVSGKRTYVINPGNLGRFELLKTPELTPLRQFDYGTFAHIELDTDGTLKKLVQYLFNAPEREIGHVRQIGEFTFNS